MILIKVLIFLVGIYLSVYVAYNLMLLVAHFLIRDPERPLLTEKTRFAVVIPAHDEELLISRLLKSIKAQNYPAELFDAVVIADNCTDKTASVAAENGAVVLERFDDTLKGKGHAIKWAIENIDIRSYDAVFIIDADSVMSETVLKELDQILQRGETVIQCYNGVANPDDSWFTRLLDVSRTIGNEIYHPAKIKLGLSSYLMGNGMCFSSRLLTSYGWDAFTVGEDWEYYARLIQDGEKIAFASRARVYHQESSSIKQATSQRMRWSSGRFAVAWNYGLRLMFRGLAERDLVKLDSSVPLVLPNPSLGINITFTAFVASLAILRERAFIIWFLVLVFVQFLVFMSGIIYTRNRFEKFLSIFVTPLFLVWKMGIDILSAIGIGRKEWVRTERKP